MSIMHMKFDGHCPLPQSATRLVWTRKFRDEPVRIESATLPSGRVFFSATVRGCRVDCCTTLQHAVECAATEAANIQINVTTIRNL